MSDEGRGKRWSIVASEFLSGSRLTLALRASLGRDDDLTLALRASLGRDDDLTLALRASLGRDDVAVYP